MNIQKCVGSHLLKKKKFFIMQKSFLSVKPVNFNNLFKKLFTFKFKYLIIKKNFKCIVEYLINF